MPVNTLILCGLLICLILFLNDVIPVKSKESITLYKDEYTVEERKLFNIIKNDKAIKPMYVECVVTCVNYSDFLSHALLFNKKHFDRLVVVTKPDDWHTKQVAKFHHVEVIETEDFGNNFNKAKGINIGLKALSKKGWVTHIDGDICLSIRHREILSNIPLDPSCLYGMDRVMVPDPISWFNFISKPQPMHEDNVFVHTEPFPVGTRVFKSEYNGWLPIGYFQMWNPKVSGIDFYPENHESAARSDMLFALQWSREKRILLPELLCYHLATSDNFQMKGKNWYGRTTQPFVINEV